jgi:hypothetical protein
MATAGVHAGSSLARVVMTHALGAWCGQRTDIPERPPAERNVDYRSDYIADFFARMLAYRWGQPLPACGEDCTCVFLRRSASWRLWTVAVVNVNIFTYSDKMDAGDWSCHQYRRGYCPEVAWIE